MTPNAVSDLDLRLDPWDAGYGSELPLAAEAAPEETADLGVEVAPAQWQPLVASAESRDPARCAGEVTRGNTQP